mmetsp:Transcript_8627/g.22167  ORF Transcript_8627/g.22167 Transcript_8627/m.22167 type:complete len:377 (+) Transcript_8627:723-1853(+)
MDGATAADDASEALGSERDGGQQDTSVDGPVVHALLCLLHERLAKQFPGDVLHDAVSLLQALVDGHSADGHGRVAHHPLARRVDVIAGGEIHDGVRAPHGRPLQLLDLLLDGAAHGRVAHVGVDLGSKVAANDGGLQLCVAPVGWDDCTAAGNLRAHILGVPALAGGDKGHLLRDHTLLGVVHLRAALGVLCTLGHPGGAKLGKLLARVDALRAAGVVEVDVATSAVEHHAAERDLERRAVVLQLLVHLDAVGEALLERRILDEVKLLRVLGPVDGLFLGLGQGLELLESVARLEANALTSLQLFQSIEISLLRGFHNRHRHATGGGRGGAAAGGPAGRGAQGAQRRAGDEAGGGGGGERRHFGCGRKVGSKHCFD